MELDIIRERKGTLTLQDVDNLLLEYESNIKRSRVKRNLFPSDITKKFDRLKSEWYILNPSEKKAIIVYGGVHGTLVVKAAANKADELLWQNYSEHVDGGESNAFRHAMWNALMAANGDKSLAKAMGDAHEVIYIKNDDGSWGRKATDDELESLIHEGANGLQHREMDLHNNQKGRDCVKYGWRASNSDSELEERVLEKIRNDEMIILVK